MLAYQLCSGTAGKAIVGSVINFTAAAGTTNYSSPYANKVNTTEANQRSPFPRGGTLENCAAYVQTAGTGGISTTLTVMKNGVAGSGSITISAWTIRVVNGTGIDSFAARDTMEMKIVTVGGAGSIIASWYCGLH